MYTNNFGPFHLYGRIRPKIPVGEKFKPSIKYKELYSEYLQEYRVVDSSRESQLVLGFGGFISATGVKPSRKYIQPLNTSLLSTSHLQIILS